MPRQSLRALLSAPFVALLTSLWCSDHSLTVMTTSIDLTVEKLTVDAISLYDLSPMVPYFILVMIVSDLIGDRWYHCDGRCYIVGICGMTHCHIT